MLNEDAALGLTTQNGFGDGRLGMFVNKWLVLSSRNLGLPKFRPSTVQADLKILHVRIMPPTASGGRPVGASTK